jgi:hypothetical protein
MAETHNDGADPLKDVHSPEFWDHSLGHLDHDLARMDALLNTLPPTSQEAVVVRELGAFLVTAVRHQERVLLQLAQDTAPKPKPPRKPRTARARVQPDPLDGHEA